MRGRCPLTGPAALSAGLLLLGGCCSPRLETGASRPDSPLYAEVGTVDALCRALERVPACGGTIVVRPGVYHFSQTLLVRNVYHLVLRGSGWNTTLRKMGDGDALVLEGCHFAVIENLLLDQGSQARSGSGIVFRGSNSTVVDRCRIQRFPESGVYYDGLRAAPMSSNTVRDCHFISNLGYQLRSERSNDFFITGNQFGAHGGTPAVGAFLLESSAGTYAANYHWNNRVAFRLAAGCHYNRIENNRFEESETCGVQIGEAGHAEGDWAAYCNFNIILGNTIHTNSKGGMGLHPAVAAWNATETTFSGNQVFSWNSGQCRHSSALVLGTGCNAWIIRGNILRHHASEAIVLNDPARHLVGDTLADPPRPP